MDEECLEYVVMKGRKEGIYYIIQHTHTHVVGCMLKVKGALVTSHQSLVRVLSLDTLLLADGGVAPPEQGCLQRVVAAILVIATKYHPIAMVNILQILEILHAPSEPTLEEYAGPDPMCH